jgi:hypothetical protein
MCYKGTIFRSAKCSQDEWSANSNIINAEQFITTSQVRVIAKWFLNVPHEKTVLPFGQCTSRTFLLGCPHSKQATHTCIHMSAILQDILGLLTFSHLLLQTSYEPGFVIEKKGKTSVKNGLLKCGVKQEKGQHFFF